VDAMKNWAYAGAAANWMDQRSRKARASSEIMAGAGGSCAARHEGRDRTHAEGPGEREKEKAKAA